MSEYVGDDGFHLCGAHILSSPSEGVPLPVLKVEPAMTVYLQNITRSEASQLQRNYMTILKPEAHVSFLPNILDNFPLVRILIVHIGLELSRASSVACPDQPNHLPNFSRLTSDAETILTTDNLTSLFINLYQSKGVVVDNPWKESTGSFLTSDIDASIGPLS